MPSESSSSSSKPSSTVRNVASIVVSLLAVLIGILIAEPRTWALNTTGGLLGEEMIDSHAKAKEYADRAVEEARQIWAEPSSNWRVMAQSNKHNNNMTVEARRITQGPFAKSSVLLTRQTGYLTGISAQEVYDFLISPEGFAVIDPMSDPEYFDKYVERIPRWRGRLEVAEAYIPASALLNEIQFVILNAFLPKERLFVSKSIVHPSRPGHSIFYEGNTTLAGDIGNRTRAINTYGLQIEEENGYTVVKIILYLVAFSKGDFLTNWICCKLAPLDFFPQLHEALEKRKQ